MKDKLLSIFGEWLIERHLLPYGRMTSFHIDTENKTILVTAELRGEASPIEVNAHYTRSEENGNQSIEITGVKISREWMNDLANALLKQSPQKIMVPPGLASVAVKVLNL